MKKQRMFRAAVLAAALFMLLAGCGNGHYGESDTLVLSAREGLKALSQGGWILVDAQKKTVYAKEHVAGAVNIERAEITVSQPVANMLAPAEVIARAAGGAGITADSDLLIYDDNNNMDSGRLAWSLMIYGHKGKIRVISGGLQDLVREGAQVNADAVAVTPAVYAPGTLNSSWLAERREILDLLNNPRENAVILDVRTDEEYEAGTIPGSVHIDYLRNNFSDGTIKPVQQIRILYKENGIMPEDTVYMYCKTSIRAAETFTALYNAGYRNLKIYDGAWLDWSSDPSLPVYVPEVPGAALIQVEDAS